MPQSRKFRTVNDTAVAPTVNFKELSYDKLREKFSTLNTAMIDIETKYEEGQKWSDEDRSAYKAAFEEFDSVSNEIKSRTNFLKQQRETLNIMHDASELSGVVANLGAQVRMGRDLSDEDPRFGYKTDNLFLQDVVSAFTGKEPTKNLKQVIVNAVGDDEYSRGAWKSAGVLIPEGFLDRIIRIAPEDDQLLGKMTEIPMQYPSLSLNAAVDKNHSTSFTGGTRVYRKGETQTVTKTKDEFEQVKLEATELVGESAVTQQLLRYSPISIPALIEGSMQLAFRYKRTDEFITGDGQGKYMGILNSPCKLSITRTSGQADATILTGNDILLMRKRCWGYDDAVWIFNWDAFEWVARLHIESDNNAGIIKLFSPPQGDVPATVLGRPVVFTEFMPGIQSGQDGNVVTEWGDTTLGSVFAACVNPTQYLHGQTYTDQARSVHVRFSEREEVFQFVMADDARPHWLTFLTPKRGITTRSPIVLLNNTSVA